MSKVLAGHRVLEFFNQQLHSEGFLVRLLKTLCHWGLFKWLVHQIIFKFPCFLKLLLFNFLSSFFGLPLKSCRFENCQLNEVDFTDADLSSAVLRNCDLNQTIFENTRLHKADLRQSYGFSIDPEVNPIHEARFSKDSLEGLLHKHNLRIE